MKSSQFLWRLGGYRPWLYAADVASNILFQQFRIAFGLLIQAFFNALTPDRHLSLAIWVPLVLVAVTALTRFCVFLSGTRAYILHRFSVNSLLRRNLLERILERPGAQAVPCSPGEAISRFRDDVQQVESMFTIVYE